MSLMAVFLVWIIFVIRNFLVCMVTIKGMIILWELRILLVWVLFRMVCRIRLLVVRSLFWRKVCIRLWFMPIVLLLFGLGSFGRCFFCPGLWFFSNLVFSFYLWDWLIGWNVSFLILLEGIFRFFSFPVLLLFP
jgi:hypothetical protein